METKEILVIVLIGILLLVVGLQSIQITKASNVGSVVPTTTGAVVKAPSTGGSSHSSTNLQSLPSMVGGC